MEWHAFSPSQHDKDDGDDDKNTDDGQQHPQNNCNSVCCRELEFNVKDSLNFNSFNLQETQWKYSILDYK